MTARRREEPLMLTSTNLLGRNVRGPGSEPRRRRALPHAAGCWRRPGDPAGPQRGSVICSALLSSIGDRRRLAEHEAQPVDRRWVSPDG